MPFTMPTLGKPLDFPGFPVAAAAALFMVVSLGAAARQLPTTLYTTAASATTASKAVVPHWATAPRRVTVLGAASRAVAPGRGGGGGHPGYPMGVVAPPAVHWVFLPLACLAGVASTQWLAPRPSAVMAMAAAGGESDGKETKIPETDAEWRQVLTPQQFQVLRKKGTEAPRTGAYDKFYPKEGYFVCAGCRNPLYSAAAKFDSGCGWPAFDKCYKGSIKTEIDNTLFMRRIEIMCNKCGGHLGHVFEKEGFTSTNERHCVNSISMDFVPTGQPPAPEEPLMK